MNEEPVVPSRKFQKLVAYLASLARLIATEVGEDEVDLILSRLLHQLAIGLATGRVLHSYIS